MTPQRLAKLEAICAAGDQHELRAASHWPEYNIYLEDSKFSAIGRVICQMNKHFEFKADAAKLVTAWNALPELLAEVKRLRALAEGAVDAEAKRACFADLLKSGPVPVQFENGISGLDVPQSWTAKELHLTFARSTHDAPEVSSWGIKQWIWIPGYGPHFRVRVPWAAVRKIGGREFPEAGR